MSLRELSQKIQNLKALAESSAGDNPANYNTKLGRINRAKHDLQETFIEYRKCAGANSVLIITTGEGSDDFTRIAKEECGCFSSNLSDMFELLTEAIPVETYRNRAAGPLIYDTININMDLIAGKIGLAGVPYMHFTSKENYILKERSDLIQMAKNAVFKLDEGAIIPVFFTIDKVSEQSIAAGYVGANLPIVMHTNDSETAEKIFEAAKGIADNVFLVVAGKTESKDIIKASNFKLKVVTAESVEKTLAAIAQQVRK